MTNHSNFRREMRQFENAWYSQAAIDRSKIRLQRLGYFETVEVETPAVAGTSTLAVVVRCAALVPASKAAWMV